LQSGPAEAHGSRLLANFAPPRSNEVGAGWDSSVDLRLVDSTTGSQVWSTRFDLPNLNGSFEASRRLRKLVSLLSGAIQSAEARRILALPLEKLNAMELTLRGWSVFWDSSHTLAATLEAQKLFAIALRLDQNLVLALAYQCLNWESLNDVDPNIDRARMLQQVDELSLRAINLDPTDPFAWYVRAGALADAGRWSAALEANAKMIRLDPFSRVAYEQRAWTINMTGRPAEALPIVNHAILLDSDDPGWSLRVACEAQMLLGRNDDAITTCEKAAGTTSDWLVTSFLVAAYANRGDADKAVAARDQMLRIVLGYTIAQLKAKHYSDVPRYVRMAEATWYAGLRKAGIPER